MASAKWLFKNLEETLEAARLPESSLSDDERERLIKGTPSFRVRPILEKWTGTTESVAEAEQIWKQLLADSEANFDEPTTIHDSAGTRDYASRGTVVV